MGEASHHSSELQACIDRLKAGDPAAREELIGYACERLRRLTRKMLKGFTRVRHWEETEDVLQNALVRLWNALRQITPGSAREFYALAALQIRRELIDLARQHFGPQGMGANQAGDLAGDDSANAPHAVSDKPDSSQEPSGLAVWSEFHQQVDRLPQEEREVFDLLWYQELTQADAAALLGISEATLKRRWLSARRRLHDMLPKV
jgi:RNA polymerase sigma-70 factor (ECF subfamily)